MASNELINNQSSNMATKRTKATKGFKEFKKANSNQELGLTTAGNELLGQMAQKLGVSASEVVDQMAKGKIAVQTPSAESTIAIKSGEVVLVPAETATAEEKIRELEEQLQGKTEKIAHLEQEVAQQETLQESYQTASIQSEQQQLYIQELEEARSRHRQEIQQLNQQLSQLQAQLAQAESHRQTEKANQDKKIEALQAHLKRLEHFATIGERELNRWRSQSIQ